jgi:hypothetical protein
MLLMYVQCPHCGHPAIVPVMDLSVVTRCRQCALFYNLQSGRTTALKGRPDEKATESTARPAPSRIQKEG